MTDYFPNRGGREMRATEPASRSEIEVEMAREIGRLNWQIGQWVAGGIPESVEQEERFWAETEALLRRSLKRILSRAFLETWQVVSASGLLEASDFADEWGEKRSAFSAAKMTATWRARASRLGLGRVAAETLALVAESDEDDLADFNKTGYSQKALHANAGGTAGQPQPAVITVGTDAIKRALARMMSAKKAAQTAKNETTASISQAIIQAAAKKLGVYTEAGTVEDEPLLIWALEQKRTVEKHCAFCPFMHRIGPKHWKKFVPNGPPAHFGCACGLLVYPSDYIPRPQLVSDGVIWAAADKAGVTKFTGGGGAAA